MDMFNNNLVWGVFAYEVKRAIQMKLGIKKNYVYEFAWHGRKVLNDNDGNLAIQQMIQKQTPFCVARLGTVESNLIAAVLKQKAHIIKSIQPIVINQFHINAGFFPATQNACEQYAETILELMSAVDLYACWNTNMEVYYVRNCLKDTTVLAQYGCLEPFYYDSPWSLALAGKKILVIHPFAKTIEMQYQKREKLFGRGDVLPAFELKTIRAVQSIAGQDCGFPSWFDALESMFDQAMSVDFDVCIIGCGAYAFPLACKLRQNGRSAITMCGPTQLLFGIKGSRWINNPLVTRYFNSNWVFPSEEETPAQFRKVESGCYW
jgi:hypothetical protein